MKKISTFLFVLALTAACSPISHQAQQDLAKPIDCRTAPGDIRVL